MHNPESVLENDTHKLLWDFEIQTDHLISARWPDLIIINKKERTCRIVDFTFSADHRVKLKESEKKDKYLDLARELKKLWNMKATTIPVVIDAFWYSHQMIGTRTGWLGYNRMGGDCPIYIIIENDQNTEKNPGDLRRLAVTQTPVKDHQLTLIWKSLNKYNNNNNKPCQQMVYAQPSTCPRKWHTQTPLGLWHTNGSPNLGQKTRPDNNQQKKKIYKIVDFAVPAE